MLPLKRAIIECGKEIVDLGLVKATSGNISLRGNSDDSFFITPSGYPLNSLFDESIVEVDKEGKPKSLDMLKPSMETGLHLAIYRTHSEAKAIVHAHPLYSTILGTIIKLTPITYEAAMFVEPTDYVPAILPGTKELAEAVAKTTAQVIVLKQHGVVVWGSNLKECLFRLQVLEENAEQIFIAKTMGYIPKISKRDIIKLKTKE